MTTQEIKMKAFHIIEQVIILQHNVNNGCEDDSLELESKKTRLQGIKEWAIKNDLIQDFRHYFASNNFGYNKQFIASELASFFN